MSTLPKILTGSDNFKNLVLKSDMFVDKSMFIKEIVESSPDVLLITRPRRWGKSMNMSMLQKFLEIETDENGVILAEESINHKLFTGGEIDLGLPSGKTKILKPLKIANCIDIIEDYQGKFPVILISFKECKGASYEEIENKIRLQILSMYDNYKYLNQYIYPESNTLSENKKEQLRRYFSGNITTADIENSLFFLSHLLCKHFGRKTWILIDEYDTPINHAYTEFGHDSGELKKILLLFRGILGAALKGNDSLEKGLITGILRIAKANLFSDLNNIKENTILDHAFAKFYGFTQSEVDELLSAYPAEIHPERIKFWYNGYTFGGETVYNPWSIAQCLSSEGVLDTYWIDSGGTGLIDKALVSDEAQEDMQTLLSGSSITIPIAKQINFEDLGKPRGFFSLLLFAGYLNPQAVDAEESLYSLSIPNQEVRTIYKLRVTDWLVEKLKTDTVTYYHFATLLAQNRPAEFKERLQEFLQNATSFLQVGVKKAELFYSGFMLCLANTLSATHLIESERESGDGRPDIVLIPKSDRNELAIIIEYKTTEKPKDLDMVAEGALKQIQNKKYDTKLKEYSHIKHILKIGMAFSGKEVEMVYTQDEF